MKDCREMLLGQSEKERKNMRKKILAIILSGCMSMTIMTPVVYADEVLGKNEDNLESEMAMDAIQNEEVKESDMEVENIEQNKNTLALKDDLVSLENISQDTWNTRINQLRQEFPDYSTWTDTFDGGKQCWGFARLMAYRVFDEHASGWTKSTDINSVKKGDIVQYGNTSGSGHTIFVTDVSGNTITFVDCNGNGNYSGGTKVRSCGIKWDNTITKGSAMFGKYSFSYLLSSPMQETGNNPVGRLDSASGGTHSVNVRGWAIDKDDYNTALQVHIYLDDEGVAILTADQYRPDVNNDRGCGDYHGFEAQIELDKSIVGEHTLRAYAINIGSGTGNQMIGEAKVNISADTENPVISDYKVTDLTTTGYTVSCTVIDNTSVDRVQFPTWTTKDGQDDIIPAWQTNSAASGTQNGNTYTYRVNTTDHNNESGLYNTHIYAFDKYGNSSCVEINSIEVPVAPIVYNGFKDDFYAKIKNAYTDTALTKIDGEDNKDVCFSEDTDSRTQMWHFVKNEDGNSYTISCEDDEALVLDVYSGADEDEANVWVWSRNGSKAQKWEILDNNGSSCLRPTCSTTKVLDTPGGKTGTQNAQIYSYNSGHGAEMNIIEVNPTEVELQRDKMVSSGKYNGHRYEILDQETTWSDAKRACEAAGGHLVSITDAEEQKFIETLLEKSGLEHYWIGMYRNQDVYMWLTEEKSDYSNWNTGEPNGLSEGRLKEYCTEILNTGENKGKWNDLNNDPKINIGIICEYDSIKDYTLNYDANGGTNAPEKITDQQDAIIKISKDTPICSGYEFIGWSTDKNATIAEYQPGSEIELTKDITLYAVWEKLEATGTCGKNLSWKLNKQGIMTISGEGAMQNYTYKSEMPWYVCQNKIKSIVIEEGITTIGDYAFYGMTDSTEITIPEGVKTIGAYAFKNSTKIANVKLPGTLTKLGESAFYGCTSLKTIAIPEGLYTIWGYTFKNCTSLTEVTLPKSLIKIDEAAFYGCTSLKAIAIPEDVSIIGIYCFKNCSNLSEISLPKSMTKIREAAFYGTAITEITIPDSVTAVGSYAFKNCTKLKKANLSKELKTIDESAFYACESLTKLILPSKVTTIGDYAFRRCTGLQVAEFSDSLNKIGESAFYGCSDLSELVLPEGMTEIGAYAFKGCTNVNTVSLPSTLNVIGESGFYGCNHIKAIEIPKSVNKINNYAFSRCGELGTVIFKGDAPEIAEYAFSKVKASAYYPEDNKTWTQDKLKNYGGILTWSETK